MTTQGTHWDGCWKEHQACAWAEVERLRAERDALAAEQAQKIERLREEVMHLKRMEQHGIAVRRALLDECDSLRQDLAATLAERDALAAQLAGYDTAREMLNVQDNQIDALRALLREANMWVREFDGDDSDGCLCNRISLALKDKP